nr:thermonuclease family protein [Dendronalium sp. ChiSLP03b]MDZ8203450.1 thermonuclease family protein [Dendronalium sp. ChiSLP03b]
MVSCIATTIASNMKSLWRTGIILAAIATATTTTILIFQRTNNSSIALSEDWIVIDVADGDSMTVRQTDGSQIEVELCGIDASELKQDKAPGQSLGNEAKQKLQSLVADADNEVMIVPVQKDSEGRTVAEVMARGQGEAEISFQEELLKSGLAKMHKSGMECPNQLAFEQAQKIGIASKAGLWRQHK